MGTRTRAGKKSQVSPGFCLRREGMFDEQGAGILATTSDEDYGADEAKIVSGGREIGDWFTF